jgi:FkbM family methyltransferase
VKSSQSLRIANILRKNAIEVVVDVGAHEGGYALSLREGGYQGWIISVEPQEHSHRRLQEVSVGDPLWQIYRRCAIAKEEGSCELHVSEDCVSSSILELSTVGAGIAASAKQIGSEAVDCVTLDALLADACRAGSRVWLKLDVQGMEHQILASSKLSLPQVVGIQAEASVQQMYQGQHGFLELIDLICSNGFQIWAILPGFSDPVSGRMHQMDVVAVRDQK